MVMRKHPVNILKKTVTILGTLYALRMKPNQIQNIVSVMKMQTTLQQLDRKSEMLYNTLDVKSL